MLAASGKTEEPKVEAVAPVVTNAVAAWQKYVPPVPVGVNPVTGRQDREEVFAFVEKPEVRSQKSAVSGQREAGLGHHLCVKRQVRRDGGHRGQGRKIVRHLASGVLGKNAPWPFKQDSLAQSLEWDGKDDAGKPAPEGCKVKVGLGLKATLDRLIGGDPRAFHPVGMTCDDQGNLFAVTSGGGVCVLDRDGGYVRTIWPFPATLPPEKVAAIQLTKRTDGKMIPNLNSDGELAGSDQLGRGMLPRQSPVVTPDGKELLIMGYTHNTVPQTLVRMGTDGSLPAGSTVMICKKFSPGTMPMDAQQIALSPDGTWVYFGSADTSKDHVVFRRKLAELKDCPVQAHKAGLAPEPFLGELGKPGNDDRHFNKPFSVACDQAGNIYVADLGNNRIQIFDSDGKFLRSLAVDTPLQVAVRPKGDAIYVYRYGSKNDLAKLDKDGKQVATVPLKPMVIRDAPVAGTFCLDASAEPPVLWKYDANGLFKYIDRGDRLELAKDIGADVKTQGNVLGMGNFFISVWTGRGRNSGPSARASMAGPASRLRVSRIGTGSRKRTLALTG